MSVQVSEMEEATKKAAESYDNSVIFMKQLTAIFISNITFEKNLFADENYERELVFGVVARILKADCRDEMAQFLSMALRASFEAFDKKYLHKLVVCFHQNSEAENILEYIVCEYTYTETGVTMDTISKSEESANVSQLSQSLRDEVTGLMRTCHALTDIEPETVELTDITLRLYYSYAAPNGYQAPGFKPISHEQGGDLLASSNVPPLTLGFVQTPFHSVVAQTGQNFP